MARQPKKIGRPTIYSKDLALKVCFDLARGKSLRRICEDEDMPNADTIYTWLLDGNHKEFSEQYARARNVQAELMFEEILDIADDGSNDFMTITKGDETYNVEDREVTNRSRLRVDSRKWFLSKVLPKKFGDKVDVTSGGETIKGNTIVLKDFKDATGSE